MVLSEPEGLLRIAIVDLETAEASSDPAVFREGAWGFWLQQAVEKALKAWLLQLGGDPPLTHDLRRLLCCWLNSPSMPCSSATTLIPLPWGWIGRPSTGR
ncbi:MAG: HEPN domain-containing protein [Cyanobacteria bacterium K_Offshore_surface_m2_239]|nr:HEPN domain-containing protein [Cyanobacteria bacterium K_Offshore_surface_m2_239]